MTKACRSKPLSCMDVYQLFRNSLKPFQHAKHDGHGGKADQGEDTPCHPLLREGFQHLDTEENQEVTNGSSRQPQALTHTDHVARCNLGDKRESQR